MMMTVEENSKSVFGCCVANVGTRKSAENNHDRKQIKRCAATLRSSQHEHFVDASIRQCCASVGARFHASTDFDTKRQFLVGRVERVIYDRYKVTITGSVPMQSTSGETKLHFRIKGEIDKLAVRLKAADRSRWNPIAYHPKGGRLGQCRPARPQVYFRG
jgi:hypothetical protein